MKLLVNIKRYIIVNYDFKYQYATEVPIENEDAEVFLFALRVTYTF